MNSVKLPMEVLMSKKDKPTPKPEGLSASRLKRLESQRAPGNARVFDKGEKSYDETPPKPPGFKEQ